MDNRLPTLHLTRLRLAFSRWGAATLRSRWSSFWTIIASMAGVIGAAAAVYPLLTTDQQLAHLAYNEELEFLRVETFSEPIILTGGWYIKKGAWWNSETLRTGGVVAAGYDTYSKEWIGLKDTRIAANQRKSLLLDKTALEQWVRGKPATCEHNRYKSCTELVMVSCAEEIGELEVGVEYKSRAGLSWARRNLPYCVRSGIPSATDDKKSYWPPGPMVPQPAPSMPLPN